MKSILTAMMHHIVNVYVRFIHREVYMYNRLSYLLLKEIILMVDRYLIGRITLEYIPTR